MATDSRVVLPSFVPKLSTIEISVHTGSSDATLLVKIKNVTSTRVRLAIERGYHVRSYGWTGEGRVWLELQDNP